jgi:hypothetical protein
MLVNDEKFQASFIYGAVFLENQITGRMKITRLLNYAILPSNARTPHLEYAMTELRISGRLLLSASLRPPKKLRDYGMTDFSLFRQSLAGRQPAKSKKNYGQYKFFLVDFRPNT